MEASPFFKAKNCKASPRLNTSATAISHAVATAESVRLKTKSTSTAHRAVHQGLYCSVTMAAVTSSCSGFLKDSHVSHATEFHSVESQAPLDRQPTPPDWQNSVLGSI
uniref:Uncharacterized protein n=1 Tax=Anguilla anguilla TaxID=7936 RepID=A0A0E9RMN4_ANGAN